MNAADAANVLAVIFDLWPDYGERLTNAQRLAWTNALLPVNLSTDSAIACCRAEWSDSAGRHPQPNRLLKRMADEARRHAPPRADAPAEERQFALSRYCLIAHGGPRPGLLCTAVFPARELPDERGQFAYWQRRADRMNGQQAIWVVHGPFVAGCDGWPVYGPDPARDSDWAAEWAMRQAGRAIRESAGQTLDVQG